MISRRNIRIKVMQALYAVETMYPVFFETEEAQDEPVKKPLSEILQSGQKSLAEKITHSSDLFILMLHYLASIARYAEKDARQRAAKYLRTDADKNVNIKIAGNTFLWTLLENVTFQERIAATKADQLIDKEWVKKLYQRLVETDEYRDYAAADSRLAASEKRIMQFVWKEVMMGCEEFVDYLTDEWSGWEDDQEMMFMLMDNFFKKPAEVNFLRFISADKEEFARSLLETTIEKKAHLKQLIQPKLKNWDAERVALIDMVLLKMGLAELLYFPTIPAKVTINEYIEIAKGYSTPQSGQFVNGVLDNILKDLIKENKIRKVERSK